MKKYIHFPCMCMHVMREIIEKGRIKTMHRKQSEIVRIVRMIGGKRRHQKKFQIRCSVVLDKIFEGANGSATQKAVDSGMATGNEILKIDTQTYLFLDISHIYRYVFVLHTHTHTHMYIFIVEWEKNTTALTLGQKNPRYTDLLIKGETTVSESSSIPSSGLKGKHEDKSSI